MTADVAFDPTTAVRVLTADAFAAVALPDAAVVVVLLVAVLAFVFTFFVCALRWVFGVVGRAALAAAAAAGDFLMAVRATACFATLLAFLTLFALLPAEAALAPPREADFAEPRAEAFAALFRTLDRDAIALVALALVVDLVASRRAPVLAGVDFAALAVRGFAMPGPRAEDLAVLGFALRAWPAETDRETFFFPEDIRETLLAARFGDGH